MGRHKRPGKALAVLKGGGHANPVLPVRAAADIVVIKAVREGHCAGIEDLERDFPRRVQVGSAEVKPPGKRSGEGRGDTMSHGDTTGAPWLAAPPIPAFSLPSHLQPHAQLEMCGIVRGAKGVGPDVELDVGVGDAHNVNVAPAARSRRQSKFAHARS